MREQTKQLFAGCATAGAVFLIGGILMTLLVGCMSAQGATYEEYDPITGQLILRYFGGGSTGRSGEQSHGGFRRNKDGSFESFGVSFAASLNSLEGSTTLIWIGAGVAVAAVVVAYFAKNIGLGLVGCLLGSGLVGLAFYPWIGALIAAVGALAGIGYVVYLLISQKRKEEALEEVVVSVQSIPKEMRKKALKDLQSKKTWDVVETIKKKRGLTL